MIGLAAALLGFLPAAAVVTSHDWAGYAWTGPPHTFQQIGATLQVPAAQCQLAPWEGITMHETGEWVGLDGYTSNTVEQAGIVQECNPWGFASYDAWVQMFPQPPVYATWNPQPGQPITLAVAYNAGRYTLRVGDWTVTRRATRARRDSAEVILEAPGNCCATLPTAPFAPITFTVQAPSRGRMHRIILHDRADGSTITPGRFTATWRRP